MKYSESQYLWGKLNNKSDRDPDRHRDNYSCKAEMLMYGAGLKILIFAIMLCMRVDAMLIALYY